MNEKIYPGASGVCYWGHTRDWSLMKLCRDGSNYVCPKCCHERCRYEYSGMYSACSSEGWPVWPPGSGRQSEMYCHKCGTPLPENARFCLSCGTKIEMLQVPATENATSNPWEKLPPEQREVLAREIAQALVAPIDKAIARFAEIANTGPVTTDDVKEAVSLYETFQKSFPTSQKHSVLAPYVIAQKAEFLLRQRWYGRENMNSQAVRKILEDDWYLYVGDGMDSILKTRTPLSESTIHLIAWELKGLAQWLENQCVKNILLAIRLENVNITKDSLILVSIRLGDQRFKMITDYVAAAMQTVK